LLCNHRGLASGTELLAVQEMQDNDQKAQNEKEREKRPLPQLVFQFAAIHGSARLRAPRHRGERWGTGTNRTLHTRQSQLQKW
jgi:hypothetical protein